MEGNKVVNKIYLQISPWTVIRILAIILLLVFLYLIRDVVLIIFTAFILAAAITPWVDLMQRKRIPRIIGVLFIYLIIFVILTGVVILLIPIISEQFASLIKQFPIFYNKIISGWGDLRSSLSQYHLLDVVQKFVGQPGGDWWGGQSLLNKLGGFFGGLATLGIILVLAFYMAVKKQAVPRFINSITIPNYKDYLVEISNRLQKKVGQWLRNQLFLCLLIGGLTYTGLSILGVKYALILALLAAITEIIPFLGPYLGAIPAILLAFIQSPILALCVIILYIIIQQLENNVIVPLTIKKATGLDPIITIIALIVGIKVAGILGGLIAVPTTLIIILLIKEIIILLKKKQIIKSST